MTFCSDRAFSKFFRCKIFNDSGSNQTYLRFQVILQATESIVQVSSMPPVTVDVSTLATENTLQSVEVKCEDIHTEVVQVNTNLGTLHNDLTGTLQVAQNALSHSTDSVLVYGNDASTPLNRPLNVDNTGRLQVVATASDLDIRNLNSTDDAVMCSAYDGSNIRQVKCDNSGKLEVLSTCTQSTSPWVTSDNREAIAYRNLDLGTTSSQIGASSNVKIVSVNLANEIQYGLGSDKAALHLIQHNKLVNDTEGNFVPQKTESMLTREALLKAKMKVEKFMQRQMGMNLLRF